MLAPMLRKGRGPALLVTLCALLFVGSSPASAYENHKDHDQQPANLDEKFQAGRFTAFEQLNPHQQQLLESYFEFLTGGQSPMTKQQLSTAYATWNVQQDWMAAEFLAMTHVMSQTYLLIGDAEVQLLSIAKELKEVKGDRIYVNFDAPVFNAWLAGKQGFKFRLDNGRIETGTMHMGGNQWGGSLHPGFDIQGFTSNRDLPRLQINYNRSQNLADCDIDAYPPFIGGVIPNPKHLTYENSDSRYWQANYRKKFGDPGFESLPHP
jgi:hypothetical protein